MASGLPQTLTRLPSFPPAAIPLALGVFLVGGLGPNALLAFIAVIILIAGTMLLWRTGEPPILLFLFVVPWIQVSISVFHANWLGLDVFDYSKFGGDMHTAILLTLAGLLALAVGMRIGAGAQRWHDVVVSREICLSHPINVWFRLYVIALGVSFAALGFMYTIPALAQALIALAGLKWAFFFLLAYASLVNRHATKMYLLIAFTLELFLAIGSFFADFRMVFFVTLLASLAAGIRYSIKMIAGLGVLAALMIMFAVVWTGIKRDYRAFVSQGTSQQVVNVDLGTRLGKIIELIEGLDESALSKASDDFLRRLSYVEFFSVVLYFVPASTPHENGAIFGDAITRPFMPRFLFPEKSIIDDTERTNFYTSGLAGNSEATSISLGFVAESYIDFGSYGMMAALLLLGIFYGLIYRFFLHWRFSRGLLGMGIASAVLIGASALETSITKIMGGMVVLILVACLVMLVVVPRTLRWIVPGLQK